MLKASQPIMHATFETGAPVKPEDQDVSLSEASAALERSLSLLSRAADESGAWHDAQKVLDSTADALDEAGLALSYCASSSDVSEELASRVRQLSETVLAGRRALLAVAAAAAGPAFVPSAYNDRKEDALVVWATHTGTARKFASELSELLGDVDAVNMRDLTLEDVARRRRVFFLCSTFGIGRPPRDGEAFLAALQLLRGGGSDGQKPLDGVEVAVAALGNSRFENFGAFGHMLSHELQALGATEVLPVTPMDRRTRPHDQLEAFRKWQQQILTIERCRLI